MFQNNLIRAAITSQLEVGKTKDDLNSLDVSPEILMLNVPKGTGYGMSKKLMAGQSSIV